jgi:MFS family permease
MAKRSGAAVSADDEADFYPNKAGAYYGLFILAGCVMFTVLDRQILNLMVEPVKQDFNLTDTQMALLLGVAFSSTYFLCGLPIARIADTHSRRLVISCSVAFWSFFTVLSGFAQNFWHMFIARMGIGAGESGYSPATWSILSDTFPRHKLAVANGILGMGNQMGQGLALIVGGSALHIVAQFPPVHIPGVGELRPWQWAFIIVGAPGLIWALLVQFTMKDPPRRGIPKSAKPKPVPIKRVFGYMFDDWRCFGPIMFVKFVKLLLSMGTTAWMPTLLRREFGWELTKIGLVQGAVIFIITPTALFLGGKLSERWSKQGNWEANMRIVSYTSLCMIPTASLYPQMPTAELCLALYALNIFIAGLGFGPSAAALQMVTPNQMRSQVSAVGLIMTNVLATSLGPLMVALLTDYVFKNPNDIKYSMTTCALLLGPLAAGVTWYGVKPYGRSVRKLIAAGE